MSGSATTDNLDGTFDRVFASGAQDISSYSIEVGQPEVPAFFMHTGVKLNSITLEFQRSGVAAATIGTVAQGEARYGASQGGMPVGNLTSGSLSYANNLEKIEAIRSDSLIDGADPAVAALTGRIDVRFADTGLIDDAASGTPVDLEFGCTLSATAKVLFTARGLPAETQAGR